MERTKGLENRGNAVRHLYWLIDWLLVSIPLALVVAQLLKAASEQLERERPSG